MTTRSAESADGFEELLQLAERLRKPDGCSWDRAQTVRTLARHLVEESFEVLDAAERDDTDAAHGELGDLAFVLALTLRAAIDEGGPPPRTLFQSVDRKIRGRHPHVFGDATAETASDRWRIWESAKLSESAAAERPARSAIEFLPALITARKIQERAAGFGFDWPKIEPVLDKVREELLEVEEAIPRSSEETKAELGDLLFAVVNLSRFLEIDAESALRAANEKFRRRFAALLALVEATGRRPEELSLDELDRIWDEVKAGERTSSDQT